MLDRVDRFESGFRPFVLRDRDRPVQRDDGRGTNRHQHVVQRHDPWPIGVVLARGAGVHPRDGRLDMIGRELRPSGGLLQQLFTLGQKIPIPPGAILIAQREQFAGRVGARGKARGIEAHQRRECIHCRRGPVWMFPKQRGEPHCLVAEFRPHRELGRRAVVSLVEEQVQRSLDDG